MYDNLNIAELVRKAQLFDLGVKQGRINPSEIIYLTDMSSTLERVIEEELTDLHEPVWTNKRTGQRASSVCAAFRVLGFSMPYGEWANVVFAADVCKALGLAHHAKNGFARHLTKLASDQITTLSDVGGSATWRGSYNAKLISESGLYRLVLRSDKPDARKFQDWVTRDVLPAIRKDGGYIKGEEKVATGEMSLEKMPSNLRASTGTSASCWKPSKPLNANLRRATPTPPAAHFPASTFRRT